jgi:hypothetical protein
MIPSRARDFCLFRSVQTDTGAHPASYPVGSGCSFPGDKADHSPPSTAEVKNGGANVHFPVHLHGLVLN